MNQHTGIVEVGLVATNDIACVRHDCEVEWTVLYFVKLGYEVLDRSLMIQMDEQK